VIAVHVTDFAAVESMVVLFVHRLLNDEVNGLLVEAILLNHFKSFLMLKRSLLNIDFKVTGGGLVVLRGTVVVVVVSVLRMITSVLV